MFFSRIKRAHFSESFLSSAPSSCGVELAGKVPEFKSRCLTDSVSSVRLIAALRSAMVAGGVFLLVKIAYQLSESTPSTPISLNVLI
jgi:hypothetical protein